TVGAALRGRPSADTQCGKPGVATEGHPYSCPPRKVDHGLLVSEGTLVSIKTVVNDCLLSKTAKFCRKRLRLARPFLFTLAIDIAAVSSRRHPVLLPEVAHEMSVGRDADLLQNLLDAEKRRAQHLLRFVQPRLL